MGKLDDKVAIVTGAASGIGAAIATRFTREGAAVAIVDRDIDRAQALAIELKQVGARVLSFQADITDPTEVDAMVKATVDNFGPLDILVASAGIGIQKPFLETSLADWNRILSVNLTGAFLCGQAAAIAMAKNGKGRIINIASGAGLRGVPGRSAYGASKGGLIILTKVMAAELGSLGITVNAIAPGPIETAMTVTMHTKETRAAYAAPPLRKPG
jgi:3-oxoacyl-[acyl-carrier protein] reductase